MKRVPVLTSAPTTGERRGSGRVRCGPRPWRWLVGCDVQSNLQKIRWKITVFLVCYLNGGVNGPDFYPHRKFYKVVLKRCDDVFNFSRSASISNYTRSIQFAILHPAHKAISARINMSQAASKFSLSMAVQAVVN